MEPLYTFQTAQMNSGEWTDHQNITIKIDDKKNIVISKSFQDISRGIEHTIEKPELNDNLEIPEQFQVFIHNKLKEHPTWIPQDMFEIAYTDYLVDIKKIISIVQSEKKEQIDWFVSLKKQLNEECEKNLKLEEHLREIKNRLETSEDRRCYLEDDVITTHLQNERVEKENEQLKEKLNVQTNENKKKIDELEEEKTLIESELKSYKKINEELTKSYEVVIHDVEFYKKKSFDAILESDDLQMQLQSKNNEMKDLKNSLLNTIENYDSVQNENFILQKKYESLQKDFNSIIELNVFYENELDNNYFKNDKFYFYGMLAISGAFSFCLGWIITS